MSTNLHRIKFKMDGIGCNINPPKKGRDSLKMKNGGISVCVRVNHSIWWRIGFMHRNSGKK
jgi:hypothetical protein